jgi:putative holliday junction resolvase
VLKWVVHCWAAAHFLRFASRYTGSVSGGSIDATGVKAQRILGLDYGRARIGLAIADPETAIAKPLCTLERLNRNEDMRRLREIIRENRVRQIVVGLPLRLDGTRGEMAEEAARFARRVQKQMGLPVELVDERLTSWEAERLLEEQQGRRLHGATGRSHKKMAQKPGVDAVAAALILKEFLERRHAGQEAK